MGNNKVFLNYPFEKEYITNLLKPMLYVLIKAGLEPRYAVQSSDSAIQRIDKIVDLMKECEYSIHDLSLNKSSAPDEYARMNMPFELGIDYGLKRSGALPFSKIFLILEAEKHGSQKALSDINALDLKAHKNDASTLIRCIRDWLCTSLSKDLAPPAKLLSEYRTVFFKQLVNKIALKHGKRYATRFVEEDMTISEFIDEIKSFLAATSS